MDKSTRNIIYTTFTDVNENWARRQLLHTWFAGGLHKLMWFLTRKVPFPTSKPDKLRLGNGCRGGVPIMFRSLESDLLLCQGFSMAMTLGILFCFAFTEASSLTR